MSKQQGFRLIIEAGEEHSYYSAVIAWDNGSYTSIDTLFSSRTRARAHALNKALAIISATL